MAIIGKMSDHTLEDGNTMDSSSLIAAADRNAK